MGGYGYGRSIGRSEVEDCRSVDANDFAKWKFFKPGEKWGITKWTRGGHEIGSCGVQTSIDAKRAVCFFQYNGREAPVGLSWYAPGFGGRRYFFLCPVCGQRMRTLHFRGGEIACRLCHNLTYKSCNESHTMDRFYMLMARRDNKYSWRDYERSFKFHVRIARKEPKRPRGRPRKEDHER